MYDTILVPLDGSAFAEHVLPLAATIARRSGMSLDLVRVHRPHGVGLVRDADAIDVAGQERALAADDLRRTAERVASGVRLRVTKRLLDDPSPTGEAISGEAERVGAALIVMCTHGRTGLLRMLRGSVADSVLQHARVPVLLWRPEAEQAPVAAATPTHVLVALDGSVWAEMALPAAAALASRLEARLTLVKVVPDVAMVVHAMASTPAEMPWLGAAYAAPMVDRPATVLAISRAAEYVRRTTERVRREHPELEVSGRVENDDHPARTIVRVASEVGADLVAMTTHGRGASRLVVGSTVDDVLGGRYGATLVVHPSIPIPRFSTP